MNDRELPLGDDPPDEPEPDWAQKIRDLRKQRGERLAQQLAEDAARGEPPVD